LDRPIDASITEETHSTFDRLSRTSGTTGYESTFLERVPPLIDD